MGLESVVTCWTVRDRIPEGVRFSAPAHIVLGFPPSLLHNGYKVTPGDNADGVVALTTHPHLAPRLKKEYSYISTPSPGLLGIFYAEIYLTFLLLHTNGYPAIFQGFSVLPSRF